MHMEIVENEVEINEEDRKRLEIRAMEIYHFVRARHEGPAKRCRCGRLLLQKQCVDMYRHVFTE